MDSLVVQADRVITSDAELTPGWVRIEGARIVAVGSGVPVPHPVERVCQFPGHTLAAGFVDAHSHGGGGFDVADGADAALAAAASHRLHGTTSLMASLVTAGIADLERRVAALAEVVAAGDLLGIHLEGPWLSPAHRGAHDPALLRPPLAADVDRLLAAGGGAVAMVTLAPELPGGLAAVDRLRDAGVVAAVGHTDASFETTQAALERGARVGTHLFNAMRPVHHREPGPVTALLAYTRRDPGCFVELIADGVHLHPVIVAGVARAVPPERVVLVTDAMAAAGAADGDYLLGSLRVQVRDRVARLADGGAIAGSTLTLDRAVRFAVQSAGMPVAQAIRAATCYPAAMLRRSDIGDLAPGCRADLVVLGADLSVAQVMASGRWVNRSAVDPAWSMP